MIIGQKQQDAINMLTDGSFSKAEIARKLNVSRTALYNWLSDAEFVAALDRQEQYIKEFGKKSVTAKLDTAINKLWDLVDTTDNQMVKAKVLQYFVDQAIGKASNKLEVSGDTTNQRKIIDADELEKELDELETSEDKEKVSSQ
ncbi:MAG: phBC6A51 family helix-turn-helix protein [Sporolactobacillus sp.]